jgi:glycosyltransferase involved in cell wall biosynthesis
VRILVASGPFPPDPGGPSTHLLHLLPTLRARGHDVRALAAGAARRSDPACPVTCIPLTGSPLSRVRYARAYTAGAAWADVVYAASLGLPRPGIPRPTVLRVPGDRAWERAVNRGWVPADTDVDRFQHAPQRLLVSLLRVARTREARRATRVLVPSAYVRDLVLGWGVEPVRVRVVPSATSPPPDEGLTQSAARRRLGWRSDGRYLLAVARLVPWKGLDLVIDAVARTQGIELVAVGDGPAAASLASRARLMSAPVHFVGAVPRDALQTFFRASDYVVVYSGYEGLSHTIVEALQAGTPVIASARGGNPEIVRHDVNGLLVPHPVEAALDDALRHAFTPGVRERLAAGTSAGLEAFAWPAAARAIVHEIETAAAE